MNLSIIKYVIRLLGRLQLVLIVGSYPIASADSTSSQASQSTPEIQTEVAVRSSNTVNAITTIDWVDLLPMNVDREALMERYADLVIQRLDTPDDPSLQAKIRAEFSQAPVNPSLDDRKIRLAGYMVVLDAREERITEFLLVPYSGAGIHQPAPPANQVIQVRVKSEQALATNQEYESVWVEGALKIQSPPSSSARVAYLLNDAQVSLYTAEDAKQAEATHSEHEHTDE